MSLTLYRCRNVKHFELSISSRIRSSSVHPQFILLLSIHLFLKAIQLQFVSVCEYGHGHENFPSQFHGGVGNECFIFPKGHLLMHVEQIFHSINNDLYAFQTEMRM